MIHRFLLAVMMLMASVALSAQEAAGDYEQLFKEGIEAFDARNLSVALSKFKKVVNMPETSPALRKEANEFIKSCNRLLAGASRSSASSEASRKKELSLEVHPGNLSLPAAGGTKEIAIGSNAEWEIMFKPEWCKVMEVTDRYLKIWCDENPDAAAREGELAVSLKNGDKVAAVHLFQEKGSEKSGMVYFRTVPGNALIEIPDYGIYSVSSRAHSLKSGSHSVRVLKEGYETLDTTVFVPVAEEGKTTVIDLELKPEFGVIIPEVELEDTGKGMPEVSFRISRKPIDLSNPSGGFSFDEDGVIYNTLYKGGRIPLRPGMYEVSASAPGYIPYNGYVTVEKGDEQNLKIGLRYRSGWLTVLDDRNAEGASVRIDGTDFSCKVGEKLRLPVGEYIVEVQKDGYMLDDGILEVKIEEDKSVLYKAAMTRMVDCLVSTDVQGETVYVNGDKVPYQQPMHRIPLIEGRSYIVEVKKEGYWPYRDSLYVSETDTLKDLRGITMRKTMPLRIRYDEPNVRISLYDPEDSLSRDYAGVSPSKDLDTTLFVPYGKYKVQLTRRFELMKGRRTAYRGRIDFNEKKNDFKIQTWSRKNFIALGGDYTLNSGTAREASSIPVTAYAYFGQFKVCDGLSTDVLKATLFRTGGYPFPYTEADTEAPEWAFGASCLFLNYEFRAGGGFCQYGDANLLLSYTWSPSLSFVLPMTHFSGHDVFAGLEVASRIKYFNVNFRMGAQYLNGRFNCYNIPADRNADLKDCFTESPVGQVRFVVSVGFALGSWDTKGRNVLRIW